MTPRFLFFAEVFARGNGYRSVWFNCSIVLRERTRTVCVLPIAKSCSKFKEAAEAAEAASAGRPSMPPNRRPRRPTIRRFLLELGVVLVLALVATVVLTAYTSEDSLFQNNFTTTRSSSKTRQRRRYLQQESSPSPAGGAKYRPSSPKGRPIPDHYVVILDEDTPIASIAELAATLMEDVGTVDGNGQGSERRGPAFASRAVKGFGMKMTYGQAVAMSKRPGVKYVEEDTEMTANQNQIQQPQQPQKPQSSCPPKEPLARSDCSPQQEGLECNLGERYGGDPYCYKNCEGGQWTHLCSGGGGDGGVDGVDVDGVDGTTTNTSTAAGTWGLDRINKIHLPLDSIFQPSQPSSGGAGVVIYVIDSGIYRDHEQFVVVEDSGEARSRASTSTRYDFALDGGTDGVDCNGHGTAVASLAAGSSIGVASQSHVVGVRVLGCDGSGSTRTVLNGIDQVANDCPDGIAADDTPYPGARCVVNLSLGGGFSLAMNEAVDNLRDQGVVVVAAAGNSNEDACDYSPASAAAAITVGATDSADARSDFSNYGACVDLFAPGSDIKVARDDGASNYDTSSGTSLAAPFTAGVVALHLGDDPNLSLDNAEKRILKDSDHGKVTSSGEGSPTKLLYTGEGENQEQEDSLTILLDSGAVLELPDDKTDSTANTIKCALDTKTCADGTVVVRVPENDCQFEECPEVDQPELSVDANDLPNGLELHRAVTFGVHWGHCEQSTDCQYDGVDGSLATMKCTVVQVPISWGQMLTTLPDACTVDGAMPCFPGTPCIVTCPIKCCMDAGSTCQAQSDCCPGISCQITQCIKKDPTCKGKCGIKCAAFLEKECVEDGDEAALA